MPLAVDNFHETQAAVITSSQVYSYCVTQPSLSSWEFITTLDYEWKVIRGHLPYRWTIWIYSVARVAAFLGVILCLVIVNITTPVNCQFFPESGTHIYTSIAIWNRNKVVMALTAAILSIDVALHLQSLIRLRSVWVPDFACEIIKRDPTLLSFLPAMISDMVLLLIVLAGLLVIRRSGGGLTRLIWKQGVIWLVLGSAVEIPLMVLAFLHVNDPLHLMFEAPGVIIMTIAATRMHRSLVNFASSDVYDSSLLSFFPTQYSLCRFRKHESPKMSSLAFRETKWTDTPSTVPDRIEVVVHKAFGQHLTSSTNDSDSSSITAEPRSRIRVLIRVHMVSDNRLSISQYSAGTERLELLGGPLIFILLESLLRNLAASRGI
ncbi:hypothetical protein BGY98DRAFT_931789 [Russula aff. rugulosa BPL654]|nr:hypothetical protein BGY98DRAFT_931789 [Russula aff. rugulosa BPL654]